MDEKLPLSISSSIPLTPPLLLLGLYAGLLAVALALGSWVGHAIPADENTRRVCDAAERAALSHLIAPTRVMVTALLTLGVLLGIYFYLLNGPYVWAAISPLISSLLVSAALYYSSRKILKTSCQQQQLAGIDAPLAQASRATLSVVLCCEASSGLVVLGLYVLAIQELSHHQATQVVAVALLGINVCLAIFARSLSAASLPSEVDDGSSSSGPSLARLVADAFHAPGQRLFALVSLSTFGHLAFLFALEAEGSTNDLSALWVFPHLLKLIGLLALIFATLVVRANEDETGVAGWQRGGLVFLCLGIAGAWALSSELPLAWARSVPAGISFFFLITAGLMVVSFYGVQKQSSEELRPFAIAKRSLFPLLSFTALLLMLLNVGPTEAPEQSLPASGLLRLLGAGALAVAPLSLGWHVATEIERGAIQAKLLAQSGNTVRRLVLAPTAPMLSLFPILCFLVLGAVWATSASQQQTLGPQALAFCFLGALVGALSLAASLSGTDGNGHQLGKRAAMTTHPDDVEAPLNLQTAVEFARQAGATALPAWLLRSLLPTIMVIGFVAFGAAQGASSFALGTGLGAALLGSGLEWSFHGAPSVSYRAQGRLAMILALVQSIWLFATTVVLL